MNANDSTLSLGSHRMYKTTSSENLAYHQYSLVKDDPLTLMVNAFLHINTQLKRECM